MEMIAFKDILFILLIHWLADFPLQTDNQAKTKSMSIIPLMDHAATYSMVWLFASYYLLGNVEAGILFTMFTFIFHTLTDYVTSRLGKKYWDRKDYHNGFVIVGFDQILHYVQLFICYIWLS